MQSATLLSYAFMILRDVSPFMIGVLIFLVIMAAVRGAFHAVFNCK